MQNKVMPNIKLYRRHMNIFWWGSRWVHVKFILRELTSICVALYALVFLWYVWSVLKGPEAYQQSLTVLGSPVAVAVHLLLLAGLIFHSITWFNLAPKAMEIKLGRKRVPAVAILSGNYIGWVLISIGLVWLVAAG